MVIDIRFGPWICPECETGKHGNCNGEAWDYAADMGTDCECKHE